MGSLFSFIELVIVWTITSWPINSLNVWGLYFKARTVWLVFFILQKEVLFDWHYYDPVDLGELNRTWDIASYQDSIPNPFIIDPTLVWRAYFFDLYVLGDVNLDQTIDILDVILIVGEILGSSNFTETQRHQSDFNADFIVDIIDIIILIDIILG